MWSERTSHLAMSCLCLVLDEPPRELRWTSSLPLCRCPCQLCFTRASLRGYVAFLPALGKVLEGGDLPLQLYRGSFILCFHSKLRERADGCV